MGAGEGGRDCGFRCEMWGGMEHRAWGMEKKRERREREGSEAGSEHLAEEN